MWTSKMLLFGTIGAIGALLLVAMLLAWNATATDTPRVAPTLTASQAQQVADCQYTVDHEFDGLSGLELLKARMSKTDIHPCLATTP